MNSASSVQIGGSEGCAGADAGSGGGLVEENIASTVRRRGLDWTGSHLSKPAQNLVQYKV